jgi:hypothetical protein
MTLPTSWQQSRQPATLAGEAAMIAMPRAEV